MKTGPIEHQGPIFKIGDGTTAADKDIQAVNGDANPPTLRYNETSNKWEFSNDGTTFQEIGAGGSVDIGTVMSLYA